MNPLPQEMKFFLSTFVYRSWVLEIHKNRPFRSISILYCLYSKDQGSTDQNRWNSKSRTEQKMKSRTGPDQDQGKFQNLGPNRTRTEKNFKTWDRTRTKKNFETWDRTGPEPRKISKPGTGPGPTRFWKSRTDSDVESWYRLHQTPYLYWILNMKRTLEMSTIFERLPFFKIWFLFLQF